MLTDFLKTKLTKFELACALQVIKEFKSNENWAEWLHSSFTAWEKLEILEEYLEHLVEGKPLKPDTIEYIKQNEQQHKSQMETDHKSTTQSNGSTRE